VTLQFGRVENERSLSSGFFTTSRPALWKALEEMAGRNRLLRRGVQCPRGKRGGDEGETDAARAGGDLDELQAQLGELDLGRIALSEWRSERRASTREPRCAE
jgi:hypothetical protein